MQMQGTVSLTKWIAVQDHDTMLLRWLLDLLPIPNKEE
jgi:hypothetical protein